MTEKKEKRRLSRRLILFSAVVWTLLIPVDWYRLSSWRKWVAAGIVEPNVREELVLWLLLLAAIGLAVYWWVLWARTDKKESN